MARIPTVAPENAKGLRRLAVRLVRRRTCTSPGSRRSSFPTFGSRRTSGRLYRQLHLRRSSPLTRVQREMLAVVVNGAVGGAP